MKGYTAKMASHSLLENLIDIIDLMDVVNRRIVVCSRVQIRISRDQIGLAYAALHGYI